VRKKTESKNGKEEDEGCVIPVVERNVEEDIEGSKNDEERNQDLIDARFTVIPDSKPGKREKDWSVNAGAS
jgi:hypothetical protein